MTAHRLMNPYHGWPLPRNHHAGTAPPSSPSQSAAASAAAAAAATAQPPLSRAGRRQLAEDVRAYTAMVQALQPGSLGGPGPGQRGPSGPSSAAAAAAAAAASDRGGRHPGQGGGPSQQQQPPPPPPPQGSNACALLEKLLPKLQV
jgi:hypothetical protein